MKNGLDFYSQAFEIDIFAKKLSIKTLNHL